MVGFDTIKFHVAYSESKAKKLSETPPVYYGKNVFDCQFMNYQARYEDGILRFNGSVQKAIDGQNVNCNFDAQVDYLERLCAYLKVDVNFDVRVTRKDIATTIELDTPPILTLQNLGDISGRRKRQSGKKIFSVYYDKYKVRETIKRGKVEDRIDTLLFYDKGNQSGIGGNLLRCEMQKHVLNPNSNGLGATLRTFKKQSQAIADELDKLTININLENMKATTKAELKNALTIYAIRTAEQTNPNFIADTIARLKQTSGADKHEFWRFKKDIADTLQPQTESADKAIIERLKNAFLNV